MARHRVVLLPPRTIGSYSPADVQPNEDAARVGSNLQGVVFADVYSGGGAGLQLHVDTCSDLDSTVGGLSSWITLVTVTLSGTGTFTASIDELGDAIRWRTSGSGGSATAGITVFLTDKA